MPRIRERQAILAEIPTAAVHVVRCDLASLRSVREAARTVRGDFGRIDLLINNAGMVSTRHRMSVDGFELTFATNHLGPFLLTQLLLDRMTDDGRIVTVASRVHYKGKLDLARIADPKARYGAQAAYAQSKLANVMHTFALARRLAATRVTVNCLHPGRCRNQPAAALAAAHQATHQPCHRRGARFPYDTVPGNVGRRRGGERSLLR